MTTITTGAITSSKLITNSQQASVSVNWTGNAYANYKQESLSVFGPCGVISRPMPGRMALLMLTPNGTTGHISGFANEMPDPAKITNNVADILPGESSIVETSGYNFNIKAKLDKLMSTFTNSSDDVINTNLPIAENVVTILVDIIAEIRALESNYNALINTFNSFNSIFMAHVHGNGNGGNPTTGTTTNFPNNPSYTATSNFNRDYSFLNQSPSKMYINLNGESIS